MKIAHIADTHIRNFRYHKEYRQIFQQIYSKLTDEQVDLIVHCGDLAHTKTQLSPEYFEMATSFLENLADIAPTYVILGNHDGNLKNERRQDAVTPITLALRHSNLHLLKNAGEVKVPELNLTLNVLSVFDEDNWVSPSDKSKINIALYHGAIAGVKTDTGWTMEHGDHPVDIFRDFDYAFLGDIHKTNQTLDPEGRVRYPGSTVQQNFGETNDKGFLLWDIKSKDVFSCEHIAVRNPKPFVTAILTSEGQLPKNFSPPQGCRLRIVSENNFSLEVLKKVKEVAQHCYKPESISFLNRAASQHRRSSSEVEIMQDNMRDLAVQERLIRDYLEDYEISDELLDKIIDFNSSYSKKAEETEEISRNVRWSLRELRWSNLFNYGEDNAIDFDKINGTIGIFGKNFSGKSSIVDSLLYTLFNTTSKNERKNVNIVNQNRDEGTGEAMISIGDEQYYICRNSTKQRKKSKGQEVVSARTELNFYKITSDGEKINLNGMTRNDTDKNIRKIFGSIEDFLLTSLSSQLDSLSFIREGSTKRKEILAKFLDLEIFEKKYRLAKEDASDLRGALRRIGDRDYDTEITEAEKELLDVERALASEDVGCRILKEQVQDYVSEITTIDAKIDSIPAEVIDIAKVKASIVSSQEDLESSLASIRQSKEELEKKKALIPKIEEFLQSYDIDSLRENSERASKLLLTISELDRELRRVERKVASLSDPGFLRGCKCLREAEEALATKPDLVEKISIFTQEHKVLKQEEVRKHIEQYQSLVSKKDQTLRDITNTELLIARSENKVERISRDLTFLEEREKMYEANREAIENIEALLLKKKDLSAQHRTSKNSLDKCDRKVVEWHRAVGSLEQKLLNIKRQKEEFLELREQFAAYDLYMRCMHPNGIAYDVIKKKLPIINQEISKVLSNLAIFEVFFEEDGNKLDIFIQHPEHDPRPLSMASGAEKTMAAMAIRLAFLSVSNLPTGDIMVLDEPGTALDEEHLQSFTQLLDMLKEYFKTTLLISHLDSLKDVVDSTLDISQREGFAFINQ
tara:strand:+ start:22850 stop:25948 length:3099 start_codon:yes stop_codon:yes gene_type:complete